MQTKRIALSLVLAALAAVFAAGCGQNGGVSVVSTASASSAVVTSSEASSSSQVSSSSEASTSSEKASTSVASASSKAASGSVGLTQAYTGDAFSMKYPNGWSDKTASAGASAIPLLLVSSDNSSMFMAIIEAGIIPKGATLDTLTQSMLEALVKAQMPDAADVTFDNKATVGGQKAVKISATGTMGSSTQSMATGFYFVIHGSDLVMFMTAAQTGAASADATFSAMLASVKFS